ncbi:hypothetical protein MDA_GLEAN10023517 [Myotis davidii]|uniref:Uncharacterized protein n=1 Tax=Myotis davidii TaxID=225400 RepID=L5M044_MYODS|nr:hypothetical protein MDA_GLEAN10023517 [Myotis davidii]
MLTTAAIVSLKLRKAVSCSSTVLIVLDQTALRRQRREMQAAEWLCSSLLMSASLAANVFTFIAAAAIQRGP